MAEIIKIVERRTSVDTIFGYLRDEIVTLRLLPGAKISEAEIAGLFGVSRQPVRDAFSRLDNLGLLLIRPQKATEVKRFSSKIITKSRFVRAAVEAEVLRRAAKLCDQSGAVLLDNQLALQHSAVSESNYELFRTLDYDFHKTLCAVAQVDFAAEVIEHEKANVDRLCILGLARDERLSQLLEDHTNIAQMVKARDEDGASNAGMVHLSRLDATIKAIREEHADYFED